ncbi:MAG: class I SAM-dependent methyltransferase [Butyrivibrio sp.]|nr:class I SAM-dependent methyltransferase [Butyrivibrio sp.]
MNKTIDYYNENAGNFIDSTRAVDFSDNQKRFMDLIPKDGTILDFGCGSGRDTKCFLENGYQVEAIDGSEELCKAASEYTGITVKHMLFQDLKEHNKYDGIWACSSILHLGSDELIVVLQKMADALKDNGVIYTSFKYGDFEGERNGRFFTDLTEESFEDILLNIDDLVTEKSWITSDVRPGRGEEKWLNLILRKI